MQLQRLPHPHLLLRTFILSLSHGPKSRHTGCLPVPKYTQHTSTSRPLYMLFPLPEHSLSLLYQSRLACASRSLSNTISSPKLVLISYMEIISLLLLPPKDIIVSYFYWVESLLYLNFSKSLLCPPPFYCIPIPIA